MGKIFNLGYKDGKIIGLKNKILRVSGMYCSNNEVTVYYFDNNLQWNNVKVRNDKDSIPDYLYPKNALSIELPYDLDFINKDTDIICLKNAISIMKKGDSIDQLYKYYNSRLKYNSYHNWVKAIYRPHIDRSSTDELMTKYNTSDDLRRLILRIDKPEVERDKDNLNKDTFDFVNVYISISSNIENRKEMIKNNLKEINKLALAKIKKSRCLQKYGTPINFLRLTRYVITRQSELILQYELKEIRVD